MKRILSLALVVCAGVYAQNAAPLQSPAVQFLDNNGAPLSGGYLRTCTSGSACSALHPWSAPSTPLASYTDSTAGVSNTNPIVLDSAGRGNVWLGGSAYKLVLTDASGVVIWTQDNVTSLQALKTNGVNFLSYTASGTGAVVRTVAAKLGETKSVTDFGAVADDVTDNATAFAAAATWANQGTGRTLTFPDGTYLYTGGLLFTNPVTLTGGQGAVLHYTGTGKTLQMGPDGLTLGTFQSDPYRLIGLTFTGGASMTHGVYFADWVVNTLVKDTYFKNFGNASAWNIFYQADNWYNLVDGVFMWYSSGGGVWNGIRNNGTRADTTTDSGQSRLIVTNSILQSVTPTSGTGIYLNCFHGVISQSTVSGFAPLVQIGHWGTNSVIDHMYGEIFSTTTNAIVAGDASSSVWLAFVTVRDTYLNLHNSSTGTLSTAHPIGPINNTTFGFQYWRLLNNTFNDLAAGEPIVVQNNVPSQIGNYAESNYAGVGAGFPVSAAGRIHTAGASITAWGGQDESLSLPNGLTVNNGLGVSGLISGTANLGGRFQAATDTDLFLAVKAGTATAKTAGVILQDWQGNQLGDIEATTVTNRLSIKGPGGALGLQINSSGQLLIPTGMAANGALGLSVVKNLTGSGGAACTETFTYGLLTASTCP